MNPLLKPLIVPILKLFGILIVLYMAYSHVFNLGVEAEKERSNKEKVVLQEKIDKRTDQLIANSSKYVETSESNSIKSQELMNSIVDSMKTKSTVVYREGKCQVTDDFKKAYSSLIDEANKK